jgi:MFS family permease
MKEHITSGHQIGGSLTKEQPISIWTKNFLLLCVANLSLFMSLLLLLPTLPLYLLKIGGTQRDVGYVMGMYTLGATLMRAVSGWLLDRYGRKRIMVLGLVTMFVVAVLYRIAHEVSSVTVVRTLHGVTFGLVSTAMAAAAADSLPIARLGEGIGYYGLASTLSLALAPMVGLWLVDAIDYTGLFTVVSVMTVVTLVCTVPVKNTRASVRAPDESLRRILANLLEKTALLPSTITFFLSFVNGAVMYFIAVYASELGVRSIGLFFAVSSFAMVVSRPISGRWTDRGGTRRVVLIGLLCLVMGTAAIGLSRTITGFLIAGLFNGLGFGFCGTTLQALAVRRAPPNRWGAATGTFYAAFDMGYGLGGIVWGFVAEATGYQTMYFITLIPLVLAGILYYRFRTQMVLPEDSQIPQAFPPTEG